MSEPSEPTNEAKNNIVYHPGPPGNLLYPGLGKTCPNCWKYLRKELYFSCSADLASHRKVCDAKEAKYEWKPSGRGDGKYWTSVDKDPELVRLIQMNGGRLTLAQFAYTISMNGKWLQQAPSTSLV
jgi:hypothetical protein